MDGQSEGVRERERKNSVGDEYEGVVMQWRWEEE
jgi:hypothetical protein